MSETTTQTPNTSAFSQFMHSREQKRLQKRFENEITEAMISVYHTGGKELLELTLSTPGAIPIIAALNIKTTTDVYKDFRELEKDANLELLTAGETSLVCALSAKHVDLTDTLTNTPKLLEELPGDDLKDFAYLALCEPDNKEAFKKAINAGITPNERLTKDGSALWLVCSYGHSELVEELCEMSLKEYQSGNLDVVSDLTKCADETSQWLKDTKHPKYAQSLAYLRTTLDVIDQLANDVSITPSEKLRAFAPQRSSATGPRPDSIEEIIKAMGERITQLEEAFVKSQKEVADLKAQLGQAHPTTANSIEGLGGEERPVKLEKMNTPPPTDRISSTPRTTTGFKA